MNRPLHCKTLDIYLRVENLRKFISGVRCEREGSHTARMARLARQYLCKETLKEVVAGKRCHNSGCAGGNFE
jgi:hypothetical protein